MGVNSVDVIAICWKRIHGCANEPHVMAVHKKLLLKN